VVLGKKMEDKVVLGLKKFEKHWCKVFHLQIKLVFSEYLA